jgi:DNA topoisomerase-1
MSKNLVIVESPAKAKTIEKILGKDFKVMASMGHIRDLPANDMGIAIDQGFQPSYEVTTKNPKNLDEIKKEAAKAELVWLATDEDREGESISWHLREYLKLNPERTRRIVFHEITRKAIEKAVQNPRDLDMGLILAQQSRRVLDRLVGYELSPVLWRKVASGLSAGRVQSAALRLIVEREREVRHFQSKPYFRAVARFYPTSGKKIAFTAELDQRLEKVADAQNLLEQTKGFQHAVASVETKPAQRGPAAPFTTSTLQQEAARKLGYSVKRTMALAQGLYEAGHITYMRTDSVNLSQDALAAAKATIEKEFGPNYSHTRQFNTKSKGAQEAHEAIRPTDFNLKAAGENRDEQRLYELVWKRGLASQMADARLERTTAVIPSAVIGLQFQAKGEVILFDGFLKLYLEGNDDETEETSGQLPPLAKGMPLDLIQLTATEKFTQAPARFTEASLVKKLEELGIGRPSTYAPTISTIMERNYVIKGDKPGLPRGYAQMTLENGVIRSEQLSENTGSDRGKLVPTDVGEIVNDFLVENYPTVLDLGFTAKFEEEFDQIAEGKSKWNDLISRFYFDDFHPKIQGASKIQFMPGRQVGTHPTSGKPIFARIGRFGKMIQIGEAADEEKPTFASVPETVNLSEITLDDALFYLSLPKVLGKSGSEEVKVGIGKYGPYVQLAKTYASIPEGESVHQMNLERALQLIAEKANAQPAEAIAIETSHGRAEFLNGRFGPYLKLEGLNASLPKGTTAETLTVEIADAAIEKQKAKAAAGGPKRGGRKPAARSTTTKKSARK